MPRSAICTRALRSVYGLFAANNVSIVEPEVEIRKMYGVGHFWNWGFVAVRAHSGI